MPSIRRYSRSSLLAISLVAGGLGLAVTAAAVAAGNSSDNTTKPRLAPTQNTTAAGQEPAATTRDSMAGGAMSGNNMSGNSMSGNSMSENAGKLQPMPGSDTASKSRMAPTQNTTGGGRNPDADD